MPHDTVLANHHAYLVNKIEAINTLLWDKLIEKGVFTIDDARNIKVIDKKGNDCASFSLTNCLTSVNESSFNFSNQTQITETKSVRS